MIALALDRQAIEKKDFPISRRGYEPEAVDLHLEALAGEVERLQREADAAQRAAPSAGAAPAPASASGPQSLALVASEQVRIIVEAAEGSAAEIERTAQQEAARIRADADTEARRTRDEAISRSQDQVGEVTNVTSAMLQRVDAMENELGTLLEGLRTGSNRLTADLSLLQGNLGDLYGSAQAPAPPRPQEPAPAPASEPTPVPEPTPAPVSSEPAPSASSAVAVPPPVAQQPDGQREQVTSDSELAGELDEEPIAVAPTASVAVPEPATPEPVPAAAPEQRPSDGDVEGARLIALNMALNGQSREETDTYLRENFDLEDRSTLLDEVYATVEG